MYQFVSAHTARLARLHEQLPAIPDNIGGKLHPVKDLNGSVGIEFYRHGGVWMFRNPKSAWMPMVWSRGDPSFQDQLTMSYAQGRINAMAKFRAWFDVHALPHEQYELVDAPDLETAEAENCNRPHYLYTEPDEIVARQAYAIARIEARKAERAAFAKAAGISGDFNPDLASRWLSEG